MKLHKQKMGFDTYDIDNLVTFHREGDEGEENRISKFERDKYYLHISEYDMRKLFEEYFKELKEK